MIILRIFKIMYIAQIRSTAESTFDDLPVADDNLLVLQELTEQQVDILFERDGQIQSNP